MSAPKPLGHYLDEYARAYHAAVEGGRVGRTNATDLMELAEAARRRLTDYIRTYGYRGPDSASGDAQHGEKT